MTRLGLLLPILFYTTFDPHLALRHPPAAGPWLFLLALLLTVALARLLAARAAAQTHESHLTAPLSRLLRTLSLTRLAALLWTAPGLYLLGWHTAISALLAPLHLTQATLVEGTFMTLPSYVAWLALYWAQYPAEQATRDAALLAQLDAGLPVRQGPTLLRYLDHHFRMGPGTLLVPLAAVALLRDIAFFLLARLGTPPGETLNLAVQFAAVLAVFVLSPLLLTKVLRTYPLPDDALRRRLTALADRSGVRFHDILLWDTAGTVGNALVTGVLPRFRYVLLSDVLVETMPDEQIEAVFAHELGHIVHRHIPWYVAFIFAASVLLDGLFPLFTSLERRFHFSLYASFTSPLLSLAILLLAFGYLSRWSERQADIYAARSLGPSPEAPPSQPLSTPVLPHGAQTFSTALHTVARLNHIPLSSWGYLHGSLATRIDTLSALAHHPTHTYRFDHRMRFLRIAIFLIIVTAVAILFRQLET